MITNTQTNPEKAYYNDDLGKQIKLLENEKIQFFLDGINGLTNAYYAFIAFGFLLFLYFNQSLFGAMTAIGSVIIFWFLKDFFVFLLFNLINTENIKYEYDEEDLKDELKDKNNDKNEILLRKHYLHLHRYYKLALRQSNNIFRVGIILTFFGISSIPFLIYFTNNKDNTPLIIQSVLVGLYW